MKHRDSLAVAFLPLGAGCLTVVVLTHVGEAHNLFPSMGWGTEAQRRPLPRFVQRRAEPHLLYFGVPA